MPTENRGPVPPTAVTIKEIEVGTKVLRPVIPIRVVPKTSPATNGLVMVTKVLGPGTE